jgi:hypothetical protein
MVLYATVSIAVPDIQPPISFGAQLKPSQVGPLALWGFAFTFGVAAQAYRYINVSTPTQRQQTKWVVVGMTTCLTLGLLGITVLNSPSLAGIWYNYMLRRIVGPTLILAGAVFIPLSIGYSILRYRLWDIDLIVRKTLVYTSLTVLLGLIYLGSVVVLQSTLGALLSVQQSPFAIVISTLAIAALSTPLRRRIQDGIDRRFYRKKYDAQQVLAQFAQTARDETDLDALLAELVRVVDETLQPEHVSVWLRPQGPRDVMDPPKSAG